MSVVDNNTLGWNMTYSDLNFFIGIVFDFMGLEPVVPSFDVEFKYCDDILVSSHFEKVATGQWISASGGNAATSAQ